MKKISAYILFFVLMSAIAFLYGFSKHRNNAKKVTKIAVVFDGKTSGFLNEKMVNKLLIQNKQPVKNKQKSIIDLQKLEQVVVLNPFVEKASVFLTVDGQLKVRVKQRDPVARINTETGAYYLDKQGVKVPLSSKYSARVILVSGINNENDNKDVLYLIKTILADDFLKKEVVGIRKTQENEFELSVRSGNQKIFLGNTERLPVKFKKLKAFYNVAFSSKSLEHYKTINLKYHNQVVCAK